MQFIPGSSDPLPPRIRRDEVQEGRGWLLDCFGDDPEVVEAINLANAITVVASVNKHYEGGWTAFVEAAS